MGEQVGRTFLTARAEDDFPGLPFSLSKTVKSRSFSRWTLSLSVDNENIWKLKFQVDILYELLMKNTNCNLLYLS